MNFKACNLCASTSLVLDIHTGTCLFPKKAVNAIVNVNFNGHKVRTSQDVKTKTDEMASMLPGESLSSGMNQLLEEFKSTVVNFTSPLSALSARNKQTQKFTSRRKTAENTVKHCNGSVGLTVANHCDGGESTVVVTTLPNSTGASRQWLPKQCMCVCILAHNNKLTVHGILHTQYTLKSL